MSVSVELLDPRHDPEPADYAAFLTTEGLMPCWSYDLLGMASWNSWWPYQLGLVRVDSQLAMVISAATRMPLRGRYAPARGGPPPRLLDIRLPFNGYLRSWRVTKDLPPADHPALFAAFERAALRRSGPLCLGLVYRQAGDEDLAALRNPRRRLRRYTRKVAGTMVMDVTWNGVDGWLRTLRKSRRQDVARQSRRLAEDPDLLAQFGYGRDDVDPVAAAHLLDVHHRRYYGRLAYPQPTPTYLDRFVHRPDVGILTYSDRAGRLLGYGTLMHLGKTDAIIGQWAALRPDEGGRRHLYFDMFHRLLSQIITDGRTTANAGRGLREMKADLGFTERPMYTVVAPRWIS